MSSVASAPAAATGESEWVESRLVASLMRTTYTSQLMGIAVIPILFGVLADDAPLRWLVAWVLAATAAAAVRGWVLHRFATTVVHETAAAQLAFFRRWRISFPAVALVWGLTMPLFFDDAPLGDQFVCWLMVAGMAMFATITMAAELTTLRLFLDTLMLSSLAHILWHIGFERPLHGPYQYWVALLLVLFWAVLREAGRRLHVTLRRNFELQYRNAQLIESLTRQTQAALDAVAIKNRFLASAAHDIRQPVHALSLYADWLGSEPELVREIAPRIVESTKAVNALFDSLFDLARLESGQVHLRVGPVDLAQLARELELQHGPLAAARGLTLRVHAAPAIAHSDVMMLRRIAGNLLSNAIKYTARGGVLLSLRLRRGVPVLEVWDTGPGIPPGQEQEVFREFVKLPGHGGTEDGFGLGLYIVSRLAHVLGHPLTLRSRVGRGTLVRLVLEPTDAEAAARRAALAVSQLTSMPWVRA